MARMFSWLKWRSRLTSRSTRRQSVASSKALLTFLMATVAPVRVSTAEAQTP